MFYVVDVYSDVLCFIGSYSQCLAYVENSVELGLEILSEDEYSSY